MPANPPLLFDTHSLSARRVRDVAFAQALEQAARERLEDFRRGFERPLLLRHPALPATTPEGEVRLDAERLCFADGSFDLVLSLGSLHWVNDVPGALVQLHRALKPDGLLLALFPGGESLHELRSCLSEAEIECEGGVSPRVSPMIDVRDGGALLQRAGCGLPVSDSETVTLSYENPFALLRELRRIGEANALLARIRRFTRRATLLRACELYAERHTDGEGRVTATLEVITLTGWKI